MTCRQCKCNVPRLSSHPQMGFGIYRRDFRAGMDFQSQIFNGSLWKFMRRSHSMCSNRAGQEERNPQRFIGSTHIHPQIMIYLAKSRTPQSFFNSVLRARLLTVCMLHHKTPSTTSSSFNRARVYASSFRRASVAFTSPSEINCLH